MARQSTSHLNRPQRKRDSL